MTTTGRRREADLGLQPKRASKVSVMLRYVSKHFGKTSPIRFTEQVRRFVKSYRKFSAPLKRLEAVACDSELQEKPLADLRRLGETLRDRCNKIMAEWTTLKENDTNEEPGTSKQSP